MEPRPRYAAPRRMRVNAPALDCQARRTGGGLGIVDRPAHGIRTLIVIVKQGQQIEVYQKGLVINSEYTDRMKLHSAM